MSNIDMLKVVYVLISNEQDFFYEQVLVSIISLRKVMSDVEIILLTDSRTYDTLIGWREHIKEKVDVIVVEEMDEKYDNMARSRILKTKMRSLIQGDFLYIDCDTVICEGLSEISNMCHSAAVLDNHSRVDVQLYEFIAVKERAHDFGYSVGYKNKHMNGGVLWCKADEITYTFFEKWNELWNETYQSGVSIDQLSFNEVNNRLGGVFFELPGEWNCQLRYGLPYVANAKIIHYFASNKNALGTTLFAYKMTDRRYCIEMRQKNQITESIKDIIDNPRAAFEKAYIIDAHSIDYQLKNSNLYSFLKFLYRKNIRLFQSLDLLLGKIRNRYEGGRIR